MTDGFVTSAVRFATSTVSGRDSGRQSTIVLVAVESIFIPELFMGPFLQTRPNPPIPCKKLIPTGLDTNQSAGKSRKKPEISLKKSRPDPTRGSTSSRGQLCFIWASFVHSSRYLRSDISVSDGSGSTRSRTLHSRIVFATVIGSKRWWCVSCECLHESRHLTRTLFLFYSNESQMNSPGKLCSFQVLRRINSVMRCVL
jgi:hypothetical protein